MQYMEAENLPTIFHTEALPFVPKSKARIRLNRRKQTMFALDNTG